jgi:insulysin
MNIEMLVHGYIDKEEALKLSNLVYATLEPKPLPQSQWPFIQLVHFPPGSNYTYTTIKDITEHAIHYILHIGDKSEGSIQAKVLLFCQVVIEPVNH